MRIAFVSLLLLLFNLSAFTQELLCDVQIIRTQVQSVPASVFDNIESIINDFMNSRRWTQDNYSPEERIECTILLNIQEVENNISFKGTLQIQSSRPVFNSNYKSPILNFIDEDFTFSYQSNTVIEFSPDVFRNNLTSILGYYAYMIIGYDYESFSPKGGAKSFGIAQQVVNNAQSSNTTGWSAFDRNGRNRNALVDNMLQPVFNPLRSCIYKYHREGLDKMSSDLPKARMAIIEALEMLKELHNLRPASYNQQLFFSAKADEIVNIFTLAPEEEKKRVLAVLNILDPGNLTKYKKLE